MTVDNDTPAAFRVPTEPYPGLRPFLDHESALLLGRSRQVDEVIARLGKSRFVAVIGGSGSGKSSLIRAGVVPALRGFGIRAAGDYWVPVVWTPGTTKLASADAAAGSMTADQTRNASIDAPPPTAPVPVTPPPSTPVTRLAWKFSKVLGPAVEANARRREREAERQRISVGERADPSEASSSSPEPPDAEAQEAKRRDDIAELFRQGGFSRLVKEMSEELPRLGPEPDDARFLFVIDQFEELFHPNNHGNADAAAVVDAVVNHFFDPHPRCFVVLTMRSEHLADCAGYLELPDAINASSYLVRRLDERELREAIEGPAKYFLRIQRRGQMSARDLPDDVVFEADVVQRLLDDVDAITGDPDHLPLLQHVLARTWESACWRIKSEPRAARVPSRIAWIDLEHAVNPAATKPAGWLRGEPSTNALRESLENWAESIYGQRTPAHQAQLDIVLRHLAFKDPNNGQYSQQRIDVDDPRLFKGVEAPRDMLHALLEHGYLDAVNYLFWDRENPEHVTLKVSHESFIRGWEHFRVLVDGEAERFEEFVSVLRRAARWKPEEDPELLLEASELLRFDAAELAPVFGDGLLRTDWFHVLMQYRDGERLAQVESFVDRFIEASRAQVVAEEKARRDAIERQRETEKRVREVERQRREAEVEFEAERLRTEGTVNAARADAAKAEADRQAARADAARAESAQADAERLAALAEAARRSAQADKDVSLAQMDRAVAQRRSLLALAVVALMLLFVVVPFSLFAFLVQRPVVQAVGTFIGARDLVQTSASRDLVLPGNAGLGLSDLISASQLVDEARAKAGFVIGRPWIEQWASIPGLGKPVVEMRKLFVQSSSEPAVNGSLRALLTTQVWRSGTRLSDVTAATTPGTDTTCNVATATGERKDLNGRLFYDTAEARGAFFPVPESDKADITFYAVWMDKPCVGGRITWSFPRRIAPLFLLDAHLNYLSVTQTNQAEVQPAVTFYKIVWDRGEEGLRLLSVAADPAAVEVVEREFGDRATLGAAGIGNVVRSVPSWREVAGTGVAVGGQSWRVFSDEAQPIETRSGSSWSVLDKPVAGSRCASLGDELARRPPLPGFSATMLQKGDDCFSIQRRLLTAFVAPPPSAASMPAAAAPPPGPVAPGAPGREQVVVLVYAEPTAEQVGAFDAGVLPTWISSLSVFNDSPGEGDWVTTNDEAFRGWIAYRSKVGGKLLVRGVPWSTGALRALAKVVEPMSKRTRTATISPGANAAASSSTSR